MKKLFLTSMFAVAFGLAITACGDDSSSGPEEESSSSVELEDESSSSEESAESSSNENSGEDKSSSSYSGEDTPESSEESGDAESSSSEAKKDDSSSSEAVSSSSEVSSSSIQRISLYDCGTYDCVSTEYLNQDILDTNGYGELLDTRNNKVYRTIVIGNQTWMAQNLNYVTQYSFADNEVSSWCYGNDSENCSKYGRMYNWNAVVGKTDDECGYRQVCDVGEGVQGVCPDGWHVPSSTEWQNLFDAVGGMENAGTALKSKKGWAPPMVGLDGNGEDDFGFAVLPGGDYNISQFYGEGTYTQFWSSSEVGSEYVFGPDYAYNYLFYSTHSNVVVDNYDKFFAFYIRCVKNAD
ncbi:MAG: fibrobacter succinogenes major paralogous domain-containing protein [Fibrobacter sp.]|nr:fibrobacter succinogenes major paralogous domain-containing protein [Fibrobacter sp.]